MKISQCIFSPHLVFFEENFRKKWGLVNYHNVDTPLFFFGFNGLANIYENHESYKIILPGSPHDLPDFRNLRNNQKTVLIMETELPDNYYIPDSVIIKREVIEIKDYSLFIPNLLGDKIYYYSGFSNGWSPNPKGFIEEIQREIEFEIITTSHLDKSDMYNIEFLKSEFYDKCFVNLNFTINHGMTTARELALMARKTITLENKYSYDFIKKCKTKDEVILAIKEESKKINTIQKPIDWKTFIGPSLDLGFWTN